MILAARKLCFSIFSRSSFAPSFGSIRPRSSWV